MAVKLRSFLKARVLRVAHLHFYFLGAKCILSGRTLVEPCIKAEVSGHYSSQSMLCVVLSSCNSPTPLLLLWTLISCCLLAFDNFVSVCLLLFFFIEYPSWVLSFRYRLNRKACHVKFSLCSV